MIKELMHDPIFFAGLGKMYVAGERFKKNIDKYGEGTAEFASKAIHILLLKIMRSRFKFLTAEDQRKRSTKKWR